MGRVTLASRMFGVAAILGLALVSGEPQVMLSLIVIATVSTTAAYVSHATPLASALVVTVEAGITGLVIGLALPGAAIFLPYLVILTLIAGILRGVVGVSAVVLAQVLSMSLAIAAWAPGTNIESVLRVMSPWLLTSIGAGLLGAWLHAAGKLLRTPDRDGAYEAAHRLLTQLRTVARRLSSGLDPVTIATSIRDEVTDLVGADHTSVFVRTEGGVLSPLAYSDELARAQLSPRSRLVQDCWAEMEPVMATSQPAEVAVALPLRVGSRMIGVVLLRSGTRPSGDAVDVLMSRLDEHSLRLDTALTFDEIRSIATVEERRRLAREIHDGIAQELASLGYVVDDLAAGAENDDQRAGLASLRRELTRVVSELRLSIFDLRSDVLRETGLGSALSEYVRQVGARSTMAVHLSLDEAPTRLRAETEAELLRIAQEAITNARKHSNARNLWVNCRVDPPLASLEVRDDGTGRARGRSDSYGLRIMKERAQRVGARLDIHDAPGTTGRRGTLVRVTLGMESMSHTESELVDAPRTHARTAR